MIKLFVCDDHDLFREGIVKLVNNFQDCEVIGQSSHGGEAIAMIQDGHCPDVILLDIHMPNGINGYQTATILNDRFPRVQILCFSAFNDKLLVKTLIQLGVKGFVSKSVSSQVLQLAIYSVANGGLFFEMGAGQIYSNLTFLKECEDFNLHLLTRREMEAALLMASDLPYKQIASHLNISPNTLENIRIRIFSKLNAKSRTDVILRLMRLGLL